MMRTLMMTTALSAAGVFVALGLAALQPADAASEAPEATLELVALGENTYARECVACHGAEGDGKGAAAYILNPKPRNFQLGVYKFRSTPNGEVPLPEDIFKTISNGISGNGATMPAFKSLSEQERWGLVHYIIELGGLEEEEPEAIEVPAEPEVTEARLANGAMVYERLKCGTCHGADGWGDGPSSLTLKNDAKERIFPTNLVTGIFKGGSTSHDLYTRISTGLDGSPMPSYAAEASPDEIWDVVHYTQSLAK